MKSPLFAQNKNLALRFTMGIKNGGVHAWMIEAWYGGEDEPYTSCLIKRTIYLDKRIALQVYDQLAYSETLRKAVLSELDLIPDRVVSKKEVKNE